MSDRGRIPIPWGQRWQRFRHGTLPALGLIVFTAGTVWLWSQAGEMPHAIGEVEVVRVDVVAGQGGILVPRPQGDWTLFDVVEANQVVAQLDDRPLRAQMATLNQELVRLRAELGATAARLPISEADRARVYGAERTRMLFEFEQKRLTVLERQVQVELDRLEAQRTSIFFECLKPLYEKKMVSEQELSNARLYRDEAAKHLAEDLKVLSEAETQQKDAQARLDKLPKFQALDIAKELVPIAAAADVQKSRIAELELEIGRLVIRAPIRGRIVTVYHRGQENVRAGDPILTVAAEQGRYMVGYVRQEQHVAPKVGMRVDVRVRAAISHPISTVVERVGPQLELIPTHLCRDPKMPEWGLPVRITLPEDFAGRPGELFELTFKAGPNDRT
jgi:multidrug resistance efflux pump